MDRLYIDQNLSNIVVEEKIDIFFIHWTTIYLSTRPFDGHRISCASIFQHADVLVFYLGIYISLLWTFNLMILHSMETLWKALQDSAKNICNLNYRTNTKGAEPSVFTKFSLFIDCLVLIFFHHWTVRTIGISSSKIRWSYLSGTNWNA